jgi:hypothetical protein
MADYTLQELKDIQAEYTRAQAEGIPISKELAQRYKDATVGIKNYSRQLEGSLKQFGSSLLSSIISSDRGAAKYNGALTSGADALSDYMMRFGPLGMAAGLVTKGLTAYVTAVTKQSDALFKTYQDLSQTGVTGAAGITGVFKNLQDFGYTVDKINEYTSLMQANSDVLVRFSGTANAGAARMGDVVKTIRDSGAGKNLRLLGMSSEAIASSTLAYARLQAMLGTSQKMTDTELIEGGTAYAEELLKASKITGKSQKEITEIDQKVYQDKQLGARMNLERQKAQLSGTMEVFKQYEKNVLESNRLAENLGGITGAGLRGVMAGGALITDEAKMFARTYKTATVVLQRGGSAEEVLNAMQADLRSQETSYNLMGQFLSSTKEIIPIQERNKLLAMKTYAEATKNAAKEGKVIDDTTEDLRDLDISQQNITQALDSLVNKGITPVTDTLAGFANAIDFLLNPLGKNRRGGVAEADKQNLVASQGSTAESINTGSPGELTKAEQDKFNVTASGMPKPATPGTPSGSVTANTPTVEAPKVPASTTSPVSVESTPPTKEVNSSAPNKPTKEVNSSATNPTAPNTPGADKKPQAAMGGILSGPRSGYSATLHGTEAVVPLPDGKTIPVNMPDLSGVLNDQSELLSDVLSTLDSIVKNMENQVSVSKKILQRQM